jgi:SIR2-like domain
MPVSNETTHWDPLVSMLRSGTLVPFLGAGASSFAADQEGGAPPSGFRLGEKLATRAALEPICGFSGCQHKRLDLARLASYYQNCIAPRWQLDEWLKSEIAVPTFRPNELHRLIARVAKIKPMLIITTNYDDLLEQAFDEAKIPFEVIATNAVDLAYPSCPTVGSEPTELGPEKAGGILHRISNNPNKKFETVPADDIIFDLNKRSVIYKIHGSVPSVQDNSDVNDSGGYLIAEEDYARFLGRMAHGLIPNVIMMELRAKRKIGPVKVPAYSFLFLGYSMQDWNLRVLLEELQVGQGRRTEELHYAIMLGGDLIEKQLLDKQRIRAIDYDLGKFATEVGKLLDAAGA